MNDLAPTLQRSPQRAPAPSVLSAIALREQLDQHVEACLHDLQELVPQARLRRAFFDGARVIGLHIGGHAAAQRSFTRLDFELRSHPEVAATVRKTIRNRDLAPVRFVMPPGESGWPELAAFCETSVLDFAQHYFHRT